MQSSTDTKPATGRAKRLSPDSIKDLESKNEARIQAGLRPLKVKIRRCLACETPFESLGNRTCGCTKNYFVLEDYVV